MRVKQLGNGGAFNTEMTNTSFLIETGDEYTLFDCGYSVFAELRKQDRDSEIDLKKLVRVYISHLDDDHVGSLKSLIYYQYFINKIVLEITFAEPISEQLTCYLSDITGHVKYGVKQTIQMFRLTSVPHCLSISDSVELYVTKTYHFKPCFGVMFKEGKLVVMFSGDTKATYHILGAYENYKVTPFIFHDFSNWNNEKQQVHCCQTDWDFIYGGKITNYLHVHNDTMFDNAWKQVLLSKERTVLV